MKRFWIKAARSSDLSYASATLMPQRNEHITSRVNKCFALNLDYNGLRNQDFRYIRKINNT